MSLKLNFYKGIHFIFQNFWIPYYKHKVPLPGFLSIFRPLVRPLDVILGTIGLVPLIVHRNLLNIANLLPAPVDPIPEGKKKPEYSLKFRPDDGFGTDINNPMTSVAMTAPGRNMATLPKEQRTHRSSGRVPDVQTVAQRLLAQTNFTPAGDQLNIIAASWIQAMVHDWIGHVDGAKTSLGPSPNEEVASMCPLKKFTLFETKERPDGHFNTERTMWWDASFLYGNTPAQLKEGRLGKGGLLKESNDIPDTLPVDKDGVHLIGDNKNSWVGVAVLQEIFAKEHNYIAKKIAEDHPEFTDEELFGYARNCISALVAKIHTIDWTVELLKTIQLEIAMEANWMGFTKAIFGKWAPFNPFRLTDKDADDNKGVPFVLTEEFAAVYRLHPLSPPGLYIEEDNKFIPLADTLTTAGRELIRSSPDMPKKIMKSCFNYPCGNLNGSNYPVAYRDMSPTDDLGVNKSKDFNVDLAAIDLYRDRERGILPYNEFRRQIHLKPWKSWRDMTGNKETADRLEAIYGPAPEGIEKCDLLVGDLYEKKIPGFAISETSFIIFLVMASRRLDADPYLNQYFTEEYYTPFGFKHVNDTDNLVTILKRHYPDIAKTFIDKRQSAFKPIYGPDEWNEALKHKDADYLHKIWNETKESNDKFFAEARAIKSKNV